MTANEIRQKFLKFFEARGHKIIPPASLVPENDPSVLFTTAGMQQFKPYYTNQKNPQKDFGSLNTVTIQPCIRTSDIDEVGDDTHLTFFEMLGNFSFGGYGKKEAIQYAYEFIAGELGLEIDYVSVFGGEDNLLADDESEQIWRVLNPKLEIKKFGRADNFWGPTGTEGPCGPTTEIYINGVEIWNIVFNQYYKTTTDKYELLPVLGIDTGMGLERLLVQSQHKNNVYETDLFNNEDTPEARIVADHVKAALFLTTAGVQPSNTGQGYILRRLIRRASRFSVQPLTQVIEQIKKTYQGVYDLDDQGEIKKEEDKFRQTLERGLKEFERGLDPFDLYQTYGFPIELTEELAKEKGLTIDRAKFDEGMKKHQDISRAGSEQKFKGGLGGTSEQITKYHTATHLLNQALTDVLGATEQRGSNITDERLRFDFTCDHKLTDDEKKKVEEMVNKKIKEDLPVKQIILPKAEAEKTGARHLFNEKYGDHVCIYYIGDSLETAYSKEFCGGPHVTNTGVLGHFKIIKEEAVAAGIRRIKAILV